MAEFDDQSFGGKLANLFRLLEPARFFSVAVHLPRKTGQIRLTIPRTAARVQQAIIIMPQKTKRKRDVEWRILFATMDDVSLSPNDVDDPLS